MFIFVSLVTDAEIVSPRPNALMGRRGRLE
jgi:hypothetical protein